MAVMTSAADTGQRRMLVPGAVLLAFGLVAALWAASYFSPEARVRRATAKAVALAQKAGPDSPVALGLAANRFGDLLAVNASLEIEGWGRIASTRQEIVQVFVQVRDTFEQISFAEPKITTVAMEGGGVEAYVSAHYRFAPMNGQALEGNGKATLQWAKGDEGWQIRRAVLRPDPQQALPRGWR